MTEAIRAVEILLVEDKPEDVELTLRALKKSNITNKVYTVGDGEEALDFIYTRGKYATRNRKEVPKVIFLDLKLPKVSGIEVLKELKSDPETRKIPVVVLTCSREESDMLKSYEYGANSYIIKPVDFEKFAEAIKKLGLYWLVMNKMP